MGDTLDRRLAAQYGALSTRLREAADFVSGNPVDVATRSMRSVAAESGLAPATFTRLARALGYDSFEALREEMRLSLERRAGSFSERAQRLQDSHGGGGFAHPHLDACLANLQALGDKLDTAELEAAVERLHGARQVLLLGRLGSTGMAEYLAYMASFVMPNWIAAGRMGASLGSALAGCGPRDALLIVTKPPHAGQVLEAAAMARKQGAAVVVITDTHACPALRHADHGFIVPSDTPHFFSSYVATLYLLETIAGMLATRAGAAGRRRIAEVEARNRALEEVRGGRE